jgi:hypothetical protein
MYGFGLFEKDLARVMHDGMQFTDDGSMFLCSADADIGLFANGDITF